VHRVSFFIYPNATCRPMLYSALLEGAYFTPDPSQSCLVCYFPPFHTLHHIKYTKRHMFGILNVDEIKN
jgi:hypothetical protein